MKASHTSPRQNSSFQIDPATLPDDPVALKKILLQMDCERQQITAEYQQLMESYHKEILLKERLQYQLEQQLRQRYGRKSEMLDWEHGLFSKEVIDATWRQYMTPAMSL